MISKQFRSLSKASNGAYSLGYSSIPIHMDQAKNLISINGLNFNTQNNFVRSTNNARQYSSDNEWRDIFEKKQTYRVVKTYKEGVPKKRDDTNVKDFRVPDVLGQFTPEGKRWTKPTVDTNVESQYRSNYPDTRRKQSEKRGVLRNLDQTSETFKSNHNEKLKGSRESRPSEARFRRNESHEKDPRRRQNQDTKYDNTYRKDEPKLQSIKKTTLLGNRERGQLGYIKARLQDVKFSKSNPAPSKESGRRDIIDEAALYILRGSIKKLRNLFPTTLEGEHLILLLQTAINAGNYTVASSIFNRWKYLQNNQEAISMMAANVWGKEGNSEMIEKYLKTLDDQHLSEDKRILIRNALLNSLIRKGDVETAFSKFQSLFSLTPNGGHPLPSPITFSTLMKGYATRGDVEKVEELYDLYQKYKIGPLSDCYICNLFLETSLVKNDEDLMWNLFKRHFTSKSIKGSTGPANPNIITVNLVLQFYAQRGEVEKMEKYLAAFQKEDPKRRLNSKSVFTLLQGYYQAHQWTKAENIFKIYYNYGIKKHTGIFVSDREVCHIMLEVFDKKDDLEAMQELFDRMYFGRTETPVDESTISICIDAYRKRSSFSASSAEMLKRMEGVLEKFRKIEAVEEISASDSNSDHMDAQESVVDYDELEIDDNEENQQLEFEEGADIEVDDDIESELHEKLRESSEVKETVKYLW